MTLYQIRSVRLRKSFLRALLSSSAIALSATTPALAQDTRCNPDIVPISEDCARLNGDLTVVMPAGENTERLLSPSTEAFEAEGFSISIDGQTVAGAAAPVVPQRTQDLRLKAADVQVKYDGLELQPRLNVTTDDLRAAYTAGQRIDFRASTNYPAFIARAEVQILDRSTGIPRVVARLPIAPNGTAGWRMPSSGVSEYDYVLRVYDAKGRYNETAPLTLRRTTGSFVTHATTNGPIIAAGEGEDRTAVADIPLFGGSVTTFGQGLQPGQNVSVMGEPVAVDPNGAFVIQRILPPGERQVAVQIDGGGQPPKTLIRDVEIPANEWFFVGIADLTLGAKIEDELEEASGEFDDFYVNGRVGYYLKGKVQGKYLITSSLDTGDGEISDIFGRIDDKDPRWILEQLDPDDFYPVYGDDSTAIDDTPSTRRFYIRVERDESFALFGDFNANFNETEYLQNNRQLYGARLRAASPGTTEAGENRAQLDLYAAAPETLPQRDTLQGTGGSAYFLSQQGIRAASETIYIEVREAETDRVIERIPLVAGQDYDIDYVQGVILLDQPLASTATSNGVVRDSVLGENQLFLIAQYEFTPTTMDLDGGALGARAEVQLTDRVRLGVTAMSERTGTADQEMIGGDVEVQLGENSTFEFEIANSSGPGFDQAFSTDGGLIISDDLTSGSDDVDALALRVATLVDLQDFGLARPGELGFYLEYEEAGFSSFTENITDEQFLYGAFGEISVSDRLTLSFAGEEFDSDSGDEIAEANIDLAYALSSRWTVEGGLAYEDKTDVIRPDESGERTDAGVRLTFSPDEDLSAYVFGQLTLDRSGEISENNRVGVGVEYQLSEKTRVTGEVSGGAQGFGATGKVIYQSTADDEVYIGYTLDPTRLGTGAQLNGRDRGTLVFGGSRRYNENLTSYGENVYDLFGQRKALTTVYGVNYTPSNKWSVSGGLEIGEIRDDFEGDFERNAYSLGVAYTNEDLSRGNLRLEFRDEEGEGLSRDRQTYVFTGGYERKVTDNWRFLVNVDALISDSDESSFRDGEFVEASVGTAYRPVLNDRVNGLFRYTYLRDLPGENQVTVNGTQEGLQQESHILSADVNYDLTKRFTLGGKYGVRRSEVSERVGGEVFDSTAHLGIVRADWNVVHKWDILAEARVLYTEEIDTTETGFLAVINRHVGNNLRVGVGYEWGRVSGDISELDFNASGVFLNITAKF